MKKLLSLVLFVSVSIATLAPTPVVAGDEYSIQDLFPNPNDQIGIRKVTGIETFGSIGFVIIQWTPAEVSNADIKLRIAKLCAKQPKRGGRIKVVEGFNDSTDVDPNGLTIPTRSGMFECLRS